MPGTCQTVQKPDLWSTIDSFHGFGVGCGWRWDRSGRVNCLEQKLELNAVLVFFFFIVLFLPIHRLPSANSQSNNVDLDNPLSEIFWICAVKAWYACTSYKWSCIIFVLTWLLTRSRIICYSLCVISSDPKPRSTPRQNNFIRVGKNIPRTDPFKTACYSHVRQTVRQRGSFSGTSSNLGCLLVWTQFFDDPRKRNNRHCLSHDTYETNRRWTVGACAHVYVFICVQFDLSTSRSITFFSLKNIYPTKISHFCQLHVVQKNY